MSERPHSNRVAIVTGTNSGLGVEIGRRLAAEGADLMLGDVNGANLPAHAEQWQRDHGVKVRYYVGDLSSEAGAKALIAAAKDAYGRIDILVNNAGGGLIRPFLQHTVTTLEETLRRNLWTVLLCTHAVLPHMIEAKFGRVINIGADSVRNGLHSHAGYNAAKGGVHGLTTGLAREFAHDGITVNTIAPPGILTAEIRKMLDPNSDVYGKHVIQDINELVGMIPMGRFAELEEVASAVSYLAREEARFITGQVISVNGGSTML
ncbi:MAG: SDR family oxidoreductase [Steroidobacteraceae bacterium]